MKLENKFRYSYSRGGLLGTCLLKYFFRYYFHWNGWNYDGDIKKFLANVDYSDTLSMKRWAYIAGKTQNVYSYTGNALHEIIERTLKDLEEGIYITEVLPFVKQKLAEFQSTLTNHLEEQKTYSFLDSPKGKVYFQEFLNSSSNIYGFTKMKPFYQDYFVKQASELFKINIVNYFKSGLYTGLVKLRENSKLFLVEKEYFYTYSLVNGDNVEEVALSIKPDLFTVSKENRLSVFDWKTGSLKNIKMDQLQYYAYLFSLLKGSYSELKDVSSYALKVYCLKECGMLYEDFNPNNYSTAKLNADLRKMSLLTTDGLGRNEIEDSRIVEFPPKINKGLFGCKACPFLKICKSASEQLT